MLSYQAPILLNPLIDRFELVDVFLCGDKLEKAVETHGERANPRTAAKEDILKNAVGSIDYDWNCDGNLQVLRRQRDACCLQNQSFAMQLCLPSHFSGLPDALPGLRRQRYALRNGFLGVLWRPWRASRLFPKARRIHGRLLSGKPAHAR